MITDAMQITMATDAGHAGRPNEDFAGAVPGAAVLLDGAGIPGGEAICAHGVAWYTHRLGGALLGRLSRDGGRDLAAILADGIDELAAAHRGTCDLADPSSPQTTVLMVRARRHHLEYLLLADSHLVLDLRTGGGPEVVTDGREVAARTACAAPLQGVPRDSPAYERVRASCAEALRARRNHPGGYWIAKDDPRAAAEAVTGGRDLDDLDGVALLSNGAARLVTTYGRTDWPGVLDLLRTGGPAAVIHRVREAEASTAEGPGAAGPDDATVVHWTRLGARADLTPPQNAATGW